MGIELLLLPFYSRGSGGRKREGADPWASRAGDRDHCVSQSQTLNTARLAIARPDTMTDSGPMRPSPAQQRLEAGEALTGLFQPTGANFETAGILSWDATKGAVLELADLSHPWPKDFNAELTIHGRLHAGRPVTLLHSQLRHRTALNQAARFVSHALAIGVHTDADETWVYASYCPTGLHEWYPERGFVHRSEDEHGEPRVELQQFEPRRFTVPDAEIALQLDGDWVVNFDAKWSIETAMEFIVRPHESLTIEEYWRRFRSPLLGFIIFASDRPDDLRWETFGDPESQRRIVVLRSPRKSYDREWHLTPGHFLFRAEDVGNEAEAIRRWLDVWRTSEPSLGLFCETIEQEYEFSPPRFLTLYTAAEGYWKMTKRSDEDKWKVDALARRAAIDSTITKANQQARRLIGGLRDYHAHLGLPEQWSPDEIAETTYNSTRRLHALMQACLLREIGLGTEQIGSLITTHYRNWPIP